MKKVIFTFILTLIVFSIKAQWTDNGSKLTTLDYVGIGTTNPTKDLHISRSTTGVVGIDVYNANVNGRSMVFAGQGLNGRYIYMGYMNENYNDPVNTAFQPKSGIIYTGGDNGFRLLTQKYISFFTGGKLKNSDEKMRIDEDGNVGIGTTSTGTHRLAVEGSIGARKVKVEAAGWSDFVFENDYELRPLGEVEEYISQNKNLPEIPSAEEVKQDGIDLGQMDARLLQKIEELTLYLIKQNKQNQAQQARIEKLEKELTALKKE